MGGGREGETEKSGTKDAKRGHECMAACVTCPSTHPVVIPVTCPASASVSHARRRVLVQHDDADSAPVTSQTRPEPPPLCRCLVPVHDHPATKAQRRRPPRPRGEGKTRRRWCRHQNVSQGEPPMLYPFLSLTLPSSPSRSMAFPRAQPSRCSQVRPSAVSSPGVSNHIP